MPNDLWVDELPDETPHLLVCAGGQEWSALYVDGELNRVGDHYLIDERIRELAGVVTVSTDDFMQGGQRRKDVAETLDAVSGYRIGRRAREAEAAELRKQAAELERRAAELVKS